MAALRPSFRRSSSSSSRRDDAGGGEAPPRRDPHAFLREMLPKQARSVADHRLDDRRVWLKKAGPRHGPLRYRLLSLIARTLRLEVLTPVPNPGGAAAIAIEAARLRSLAASGLRVPQVLAEQPEGLLISDLAGSGRSAAMLMERLEQAATQGPAVLLAAWAQGLEAIARVHARGQYLSQAFARNMVLCPDGEIGFIDFEDDPGATLPTDQCQARDWLSYLHSTGALILAAGPQAAAAHWQAAMAAAEPGVRERVAEAARRMRWLRHLPQGRRWGRDTQRVRAAAVLLGRWHAA
ncbi:hypothetical protein DFR41_1011201 [Pseudacidovorax intermedius]|uniref:tRNA A-37 threonylcarbamoyl transferase component Bud32 n=1 Tax=Pseudacidovorax intermedius TaxID=433924 RepID=A0A370FQX1_9BURK|nr:hypothetical protein [Pseudacidovorax intermedius]RDI29445.1 hypothetical protein DFR41_1011201 [Pseudacidovorax intermedius]